MDISRPGLSPECYLVSSGNLLDWSYLDDELAPVTALLWKSKRLSSHCTSIGSLGVLHANIQGTVCLFGAEDGNVVWTAKKEPGKGNRPTSAPIVHRGIVLVSKERGVYALDHQTGDLRWMIPDLKKQGYKRGVMRWGDSVRWLQIVGLHPEHVLLGGNGDVVQTVCLDGGEIVEQVAYTRHMVEDIPDDEEPEWDYPDEYLALRRNSAPLTTAGNGFVVDGVHYWHGDANTIGRSDAGPKHADEDEAWKITTPSESDEIESAMATDGQYLYVKYAFRTRALQCYEIPSGKQVWSVGLKREGPRHMLVTRNQLLFVEIGDESSRSMKGNYDLVAYDKRTGTEAWRLEGQEHIYEDAPESLGAWGDKLCVVHERGIRVFA